MLKQRKKRLVHDLFPILNRDSITRHGLVRLCSPVAEGTRLRAVDPVKSMGNFSGCAGSPYFEYSKIRALIQAFFRPETRVAQVISRKKTEQTTPAGNISIWTFFEWIPEGLCCFFC
jgi:hypothetical protein